MNPLPKPRYFRLDADDEVACMELQIDQLEKVLALIRQVYGSVEEITEHEFLKLQKQHNDAAQA
ncbi:MAG: hypothetical protein IH820_16150 [Bacteroidetes bacterium]|nr:hypothetical protein [Bacteroidota bacterium]